MKAINNIRINEDFVYNNDNAKVIINKPRDSKAEIVTINGNNNDITIKGDYIKVIVNGNNNRINIKETSCLHINGRQNVIKCITYDCYISGSYNDIKLTDLYSYDNKVYCYGGFNIIKADNFTINLSNCYNFIIGNINKIITESYSNYFNVRKGTSIKVIDNDVNIHSCEVEDENNNFVCFKPYYKKLSIDVNAKDSIRSIRKLIKKNYTT